MVKVSGYDAALIFGGEFRTDVSSDHTVHRYNLNLYIAYETGGVRIC